MAETITIDEKKCNHCGRCAKGCIAADQAAKIYYREEDGIKGRQ